ERSHCPWIRCALRTGSLPGDRVIRSGSAPSKNVQGVEGHGFAYNDAEARCYGKSRERRGAAEHPGPARSRQPLEIMKVKRYTNSDLRDAAPSSTVARGSLASHTPNPRKHAGLWRWVSALTRARPH